MNIVGRLARAALQHGINASQTRNIAPIATATGTRRPRPTAIAVHPTLTHQNMITYIEQDPRATTQRPRSQTL